MARPVPLPRTRNFHPDKTEDNDALKCSSSPPPPPPPHKSPKGGLVRSAPPPVSPKKWTVKKSSGGFYSVNDSLEIVKVVAEPSVNNNCEARPPLLPPKNQHDDQTRIPDTNSLLDWWKGVTPWSGLCRDLKLRGEEETKIIKIKAEHLYKAFHIYIHLLSEHGGTLKEHTDELLCIADNLNKVSKGTKIAGITGGATTVAGGVAAAAGVILSPFTLGASLALTAVGVGVAAAGGVTGASAAIANKVNVTQDKKKMEKTLQEFNCLLEKIQTCLKFINEGMEQLRQHDLSVLSEARMDSEEVARVVQLAATGGASARAIEANSEASGMMQGFAVSMDLYFIKGKNGPKLKKGLESKFAKQIRELVEKLNEALSELMQIKDLFRKHCSGE